MDVRAFREQISEGIRSFLAGRRIALDVSVLLSGVLDEQSPSAWILRLASQSAIVLSKHTEETAIEVLRWNAPSLVGVFGAGLVELGTRCTIDRVPSVDKSSLGTLGRHLSGEDRQILADAISGKASVLYTHDSEFFRERIPGLITIAPGAQAWDPFSEGLHANTVWTFLGWFVPSWSTDAVSGTTERFFIYEIADYVSCSYDAQSSAFVVEWWANTPKIRSLRLPQVVEAQTYNFVSVMADATSITLFANGETRRTTVSIGRAPITTFHPFMSAESTGQIFGTCRFRFVDKCLTEASIQRHWRARTLQLTDGEIQWMDAVRKFSMLSRPRGSRVG
jgi:predicted nucleic acid-binding protein